MWLMMWLVLVVVGSLCATPLVVLFLWRLAHVGKKRWIQFQEQARDQPRCLTGSHLMSSIALHSGHVQMAVDALVDKINERLRTTGPTMRFQVGESGEQSSLDDIRLGSRVWFTDKGCKGFLRQSPGQPFGEQCFGCAWEYSAGINSIRGLGSARVEAIHLDNPYMHKSSKEGSVMWPIRIVLRSPCVRLFVTAQGKACRSTSSGFSNHEIIVPGGAKISVRLCWMGTKKQSEHTGQQQKHPQSTETRLEFHSNDIYVDEARVTLSLPEGSLTTRNGWINKLLSVRWISAAVEWMLSPSDDSIFVSRSRCAGQAQTERFQTLLNSILETTLNSKLRHLLQDQIVHLPPFAFALPCTDC